MTNLAERVTAATGVNISVFGFDTAEGLPAIADYRDHPEMFSEGDYPMQDFDKLQAELSGRAKLVIGDIRDLDSLDEILTNTGPLGFAFIDVDIYSSAKSALNLITDSSLESLMPTVGLHFDDVWSKWGYNRFAGELLAIEDSNSESDSRKIDKDRYIHYWHNETKPWHASMYILHVLDHPDRFKTLRAETQVIQDR
jgi:hypothetical protein